MAHELEIKNGQAQMFSVREVPWHGLGHIVNDAPTAEEAIKLAGLDWKVMEQQVHSFNHTDKSFARIPNYKSLVRSDNNVVLSVMKESYSPLQNSKAFSFFDPSR